jgi:hypothetical protein
MRSSLTDGARRDRRQGNTFTLPRRGRGRPTDAARAEYQAEVESFCDGIRELRSGLDFPVGSRGWGYVCEAHNLITKEDIDLVEKLINDCRKSGDLPLDICSVDEERTFDHVQRIDDTTPEQEAKWIVDQAHQAHLNYWPISFWENQDLVATILISRKTSPVSPSTDAAEPQQGLHEDDDRSSSSAHFGEPTADIQVKEAQEDIGRGLSNE